MRWMGFKEKTKGELDSLLIDLMWLGMKHFRMPPEARKLIPGAFSDDELRSLQMPVLLLMGQQEVIYDSAKALTRACHLIPNLDGELMPDCGHEMTVSKASTVNRRVLNFLQRS